MEMTQEHASFSSPCHDEAYGFSASRAAGSPVCYSGRARVDACHRQQRSARRDPLTQGEPMVRLRALTRDDLAPADRQVYDAIAARRGGVPPN
jgi:hypothetical protein